MAQLILPQRAAMPGWWVDDSAQTRIIAPGATPSNSAPANLGQLKYVATQAKKYLDRELAAVGGAGNTINTLVGNFEPRAGQSYTAEQLATIRAANYTAINLGQLKAVAKPFYQRLLSVGYKSRFNLLAHGAPAGWAYDYPWDPTQPWNQAGAGDKSVNYGMANIGQLKMAFSFDLASDTDGNFLPGGLLGPTEGGMSNPNGAPGRLGNGGNTASSPTYGNSSPGGGGAGPQMDGDHDPASSGDIQGPTLRVAASTSVDPDTNLTTTDPTKAHLEWDLSSAPASGFTIQRRTSAGNWATLKSTGGGVTETDDSGLLANLNYIYRVVATFPDGQSLISNAVSYSVPFYKDFSGDLAEVSRSNPGFPEFIPSYPPLYYLTIKYENTYEYHYSKDGTSIDESDSYTDSQTLDPNSGDYDSPGAKFTYDGTSTTSYLKTEPATDSKGNPSTTTNGSTSKFTHQADGTWAGTYSWWTVDADGKKDSGESTTGPVYTGVLPVGSTTTATTVSGEYQDDYTDETGEIDLLTEYTPAQFFNDSIAMLDQATVGETENFPTGIRARDKENDDLSIGRYHYYWDVYPSAPYSENWFVIFSPYTAPSEYGNNDDTAPPPPQVIDTTAVTSGGGMYELDTSSEKGQFVPGSTPGYYGVFQGLQLIAGGGIADKSAPNGVISGVVFDPQEMTSGAGVVHPADANGNGAVSGWLSFAGGSLTDEVWTVQIFDGGDFTITLPDGTVVSNGQTFDLSELPSGLTVTPKAGAAEGETVTITVTLSSGAGWLGTQNVTFTNVVKGVSPKDYSIPLDEASGARYRKISLTGRPLADEKPHQTAETDEEKEETYIDALTLGFHHTTTDVYVPVAGSDLSIATRRDTLSEVWNMNNGLRPHERLDRPFGAAWTSNLSPYLEKIATDDGASYTYIIDQNGARHRFIQVSNATHDISGYVPVPSDSRENGDYLSTFDGSTFTDRYGTKITFAGPGAQQTVSTNRNEYSGTETHNFIGASQIIDRLGNKLTYTYPSNASGSTPNSIKTLIPSTIALSGSTNQTLSIAQDGAGHVTSIWDPNGNRFDYTYQDKTYIAGGQQRTEKVLTAVIGPDGQQVQYDYTISVEPDRTPNDITNGQATDKLHLDLSSITDASGNSYQIAYGFDQTRYSYDVWSSSYYAQTGAASYVTRVTLPQGWGGASFSNTGSATKLNPQIAPDGTLSLTGDSNRQAQVTDAGGNTINYRWSDSHAFLVGGIYANMPPAAIPKVVFYNTMDIDYGVGTEEFTFDLTAGMALKSVRDLSGNLTTYTYGDSYLPPLAALYATIFPYPGFATKYPDPTVQTDALSNSKYFHYVNPYRIMDSAKDEEGRTKKYDVDNLGRRTAEYIVGSTGVTAQETDFSYSDGFTGVVTNKTVVNAGGPAWGKSLVTQYNLDANGRVQEEIVDPNGLALKTSHTYDRNGNKLSVTDPRLNVTAFEYDKRNRLTKVVYADGSAKTIDYYANGLKQHETDENHHQTTFAYDTLNRLTSQTRTIATGNSVTTYGYTDAVQPKTTVQDPNLHTTTFKYDSLLRLVKTTDALGRSTQYDYSGANSGAYAFDSSGFKPTTITDPRNYVTTITYDKLYRATAKSAQYQLAPAAYSNTSTGYDNVGNPITVKDPLQNTTTTEFDALNRPKHITYADGAQTYTTYTSTGLKWQVQDELGQITETQYDAAGRPVAVVEPSVDDGLNPEEVDRTAHWKQPTTQTIYDAAGNVSATINPLSQRWDYVYDVRNRKIEEHQPTVTDAEHNQVVRPVIYTGYDYVGNVLWVEDARGFTTETSYDEANRPLTITAPPVLLAGGAQPVRPTTTKTYDPAGNVLTVTDANQNRTTNVYDQLNRLKTTTDAVPITITYDYDEVGNRKLVQDGKGQQTIFAYDGLNRNTTTTDAARKVTKFTYDGLNKISRTDALSPAQVTSYGYDLRNRLTSVIYPTETRSYGYDVTGHLQTVTETGKNGVTDVGYSYDNLHRVVAESSNGANHTYRYDLAGNRLSVQYGLVGGGLGRLIVSTYDPLNRLSTLTEGTRLTIYGYDLAGNVVAKTLPNGDSVTIRYDGLGRAYEEEGISTHGVLYHYLSLCDAVGNLRSSTEYTAGVAPRTVSMGYDAADRLTSEVVTDVNGQPMSSTSYDYDTANNRQHKTANGVTATYTYNNLNQLSSWSDTAGNGASYGYDFNGNRISRTAGGVSDVYTYDAENRLVSLVKNTLQPSTTPGAYGYVYDYRSRRTTRAENGATTQMVFSGGTSVQEYSAPGVVSAEYVRGSDWGGGVGGVLYSLRSGIPSFDHYDRRGDVTARTDSNGTVTWQASYEAFGTRPAEYGTTQDRQKANTKEEDPTGLLNEGMRYRDLETGTFITRDPAGFVDGPNLYAYVVQNPWTKFDPTGLDAVEIGSVYVEVNHKTKEYYVGESGRPATTRMNETGHQASSLRDKEGTIAYSRTIVADDSETSVSAKAQRMVVEREIQDHMAAEYPDYKPLGPQRLSDEKYTTAKQETNPRLKPDEAPVEYESTKTSMFSKGRSMRPVESNAVEIPRGLKAFGIVAAAGMIIMYSNGEAEANDTIEYYHSWKQGIANGDEGKAVAAEAQLVTKLSQQTDGPVASYVLKLLDNDRIRAQAHSSSK